MNKNYLIIGLIILALVVIGVIAARPADEPALEEETPNTEETAQVPSVEIADQTVAEGSILVDSAYIENPGWVVIHRTTEEGELDIESVIGTAEIPAGESNNVIVTLTEEIENGEVLIAMLHEDTGVVGEYEFGAETPETDAPVVLNDETVFHIFTVSTEEATEEVVEEETAAAETEVEADVEVDTEVTE